MTTGAKKGRVSLSQEDILLNFHPARKLSTQHFVLRNALLTASGADEDRNLSHCLSKKKTESATNGPPSPGHHYLSKKTNIRPGGKNMILLLLE